MERNKEIKQIRCKRNERELLHVVTLWKDVHTEIFSYGIIHNEMNSLS